MQHEDPIGRVRALADAPSVCTTFLYQCAGSRMERDTKQ